MSYTPNPIQAPARTRMAMPAHLEAMVGSQRPRPVFKPSRPVVDMVAVQEANRAREAVEQSTRERLAAQLAEERQRQEERRRKILQREYDRRVKLGLITDYRKCPERAKRLIGILAHVTGNSVAAIKGPSRFQELVKVRQVACWLIYKHARLSSGKHISLPQLGKFMGGRDHSTMLHSIRKVSRNAPYKEWAKGLERQVLEIERKLYGAENEAQTSG